MKRLLVVIMVMALMVSGTGSVMAKSVKNDAKNYERLGYEKIELADGTVGYLDIEESSIENNLQESEISGAARSTIYLKTKSVSARFYIVSSGATVCSYGVDAVFEYDKVSLAGVNSEDAWSTTAPGWACVKDSGSVRVNPGYVYAWGTFNLYEGSTWNNSSTIKINCNALGEITYTIS